MTKAIKLLAMAVLVLSVAFAADIEEDEGVLVLTDSNFEEALREYPMILVEFYAPWCGHCKKLAPEYSRAAQALKGTDGKVALAKVDATTEKELAEKFKVEGFPTLKWFSNGNPTEYDGGRTEKEIVSWINRKLGLSSKELKSVDELESQLENNELVVVYFGDSNDDKELQIFKDTTQSFDDVDFVHIFGSQAREAHNVKDSPAVVLFKKFDDNRNDFVGSFTAENLKKFIDEHSFPAVMPFNDRAIDRVFQKGVPTLFLFANTDDKSKAAEQAFKAAAEQIKDNKLAFSVSKSDDGFGHYQRLSEYVGVDVTQAPQLMLVQVSGSVKKFKYDRGISTDEIVKYIKDWKNGKIEQYFKSQDIPESNDEAVKTIVGKNYREEILNTNRDVLIEFYAPWCGHCKQIAPIYESVAQKLAGNKNILIAKVDATANEIPGVNIRGYPTIYFIPGNSKQMVTFEGDRTEEGILAWLKEHTTHPWDAATRDEAVRDEAVRDENVKDEL